MKTTDYIFYQIYPRSFCDSNDDGVGDLQGIISKIPHLQELGVNAVWISPCFPSPNVDNGYDISDYLAVAPEAGTMADMRRLIDALHEKGIKVILDLVANHTSSQHAWFMQARASKDNPYREYYIWRKTPPNTWQSAFGGSAWQYDPPSGEYYLHSYAVEQPDLNWENSQVRKEMQRVVDFWLDFGVDGFRCDVLDQISKDFEKGLNGNGPRLHEFIRELFGREKTRGIFTVGECWAADGNNVQLFCGKDRQELTTVFSFDHLCLENGKFHTQKPSLYELCLRILRWQKICAGKDVDATLFLNNHDQPFAVSKFGNDREYRYESATLLAALVLLQKGIPFLFQGEEIGMTNSRHDRIEDFRDVETLSYLQENEGKIPRKTLLDNANFGSRDNARHLLVWTQAEAGKAGWQPAHSRGEEINFERDKQAEKSVFHAYARLIAIRKQESAVREGGFLCEKLTEEGYAFSRFDQHTKITVICNFEKPSNFFEKPRNGELLFTNYGKIESNLRPYEVVIFKEKKQ